MFKLIKALGRLVVRFYIVEGNRLHTKATQNEALAKKLQEQADKLHVDALESLDESAKTINQAQQLAKFF